MEKKKVSDVYKSLAEIVGEDYVSNRAEERHFYARDAGLMPAHEPDYLAAPKSPEEVQKIVKFAHEEEIPIVPVGAALSLTGLNIPQEGGIVIDLKRMKNILEVDRKARNAIVEAGVSQGQLKSHLERNYPDLRHSIPDAPPAATIGGNVQTHGQGRLSQQYGFNTDMLSGLEVVLPNGEICRIGSSSISSEWFSKGPTLPDLSGLFLGWLGTTGIVTKVGIKLYPRKEMRDVETFVTDRKELVPDIIYNLTHTEMIEDLNIWFQPKPKIFEGNYHLTTYITGDTEEELEFKRKMVWNSVEEFRESEDGGFMWIQPQMKPEFLEMPQKSITEFADVKKGGGFEYAGPIIPVKKFPEFTEKLENLAEKYNLAYGGTARVIGRCHAMMFSFAFTFDRSDQDMMERAEKAEKEAFEFYLDNGGIPWKPTVEEQKMAMERMDSDTLELMKMIKENLDTKGIMNPGNWEMD